MDILGRCELSYSAENHPTTIPHCRLVTAVFQIDDVKTDYVDFNKGDLLHEYFYADRYYNIFALYDGRSDRLKGWYCNITRPTIWTDDVIPWIDLKLDLWVYPNGTMLLLDEDEFATLEIDSAERASCLSALAELQQMAQSNTLPI